MNKIKIYLLRICKISIIIFLTGIVSSTAHPITENSHFQNINSVEDLWNFDADRVRYLVNALDFDTSEMIPIKDQIAIGDTIGALKLLLEYYSQIQRDWVISSMDTPTYENNVKVATALLSDSVFINGVSTEIPKTLEGGWQWTYTGSENDDEFGYSLNGHRYLLTLVVAKQKTLDKKYVQFFDRIIKDWIINHKVPDQNDSIYIVLDPLQSLDYRDIGEVEWRTIQAGQRLGATWPQTFYSFQKDKAFSPASRLLMLISICEQAEYLQKYHKSGHNWTTMEMNGLALAGLAFPEFREANNWANYALDVMTKEINRQVYPDGVQTELSTKTQWVALKRFESVANNFIKSGREISEPYKKKLEQMYNYLAYSIRPDGHQPLNGDSDREDLRPRVLKAAKIFGRPDWVWIATNGNDGELPNSNPSVTFPWAGIHINRSGWNKHASWSFFDTGAYGTGHQHRDKLHVSVAAFGKDLLVDGGRYTHKDYFSFDPTNWRGYFRSSFSHNVILVDGNGQNEGATMVESPLKENVDYLHSPKFDYAYGTFDEGYENVEGKAIHSRALLYIKDQCWVVLDHFETDRPRNINVLWHFAPNNDVEIENKDAYTVNQNTANLRIVPLGEIEWDSKIVKGQEKPNIQGWNSSEYGIKVENSTVIYSSKIPHSSLFAWILVPSEGDVAKISPKLENKNGMVYISFNNINHDFVKVFMPIKNEISRVNVEIEEK